MSQPGAKVIFTGVAKLSFHFPLPKVEKQVQYRKFSSTERYQNVSRVSTIHVVLLGVGLGFLHRFCYFIVHMLQAITKGDVAAVNILSSQ